MRFTGFRTGLTGTLALGILTICVMSCKPANPQLEIAETLWKTGTIFEQDFDTLSHLFVIRNTGTALLRLSNPRVDCGCTVVEFDSLIAPRDSGRLIFSLVADKLEDGDFTKSLTVATTDTFHKSLSFTAQGTFVKQLTVFSTPLQLRWNSRIRVTDSVRIACVSDSLRISGVTFVGSHSPNVSIEGSLAMAGFKMNSFALRSTAERDSVTSRKIYHLILDISGTSPLPLRGSLDLVTNLAGRTHLSVPCDFE